MTEGIGFARVGWWRSRSSVKDEDKALMNVALDFRAVPVGISRSGTIVTPQIVSRGDVSHRAGVRRKRERERESEELISARSRSRRLAPSMHRENTVGRLQPSIQERSSLTRLGDD